MHRRALLTSATFGILLVGCTDASGPPPAQSDAGITTVTRSPDVASARFLASVTTDAGEPRTLAGRNVMASGPVGGVPDLDAYEVSFWAVPFETRNLIIDYEVTARNGKIERQAYVKLKVPEGALVQHPNGDPIAATDSVLITVSLDSTQIIATLAPAGLQFNDTIPAELRLWYSAADGDLDSDGRVTKSDRHIENYLLDAWALYRAQESDAWEQIAAEHNTVDDWFQIYLDHFSGYAVAY